MDKITIENTIKLLRRAKFELTGEEAIVLYNCMQGLVTELKKLSTPPQLPIENKIEEPKKKSGKKTDGN